MVIFRLYYKVIIKPKLYTNLLLFIYERERGDVIGKKEEMFIKVRRNGGVKLYLQLRLNRMLIAERGLTPY